MGADRLRRDEELLADLLVREPVRQQAQDLALAPCQRRQALGHGRGREDTREHGIDVGSAVGDGADGPREVRERRFLEHETARPRVESLGQERTVAVCRVEDDADVGRDARELARDLDARQPRHPHIDERDPRLHRLDLLQGLAAVARGAHDVDAHLGQHVRDRREQRGVIVGHDRGD